MKRQRIRPHVEATGEYLHLLRLVNLTNAEMDGLIEAARKMVAGEILSSALEQSPEYISYKKRQKRRWNKEVKRARAYRNEHGSNKGFRHATRPKTPEAVVNAWRLRGRGDEAFVAIVSRAAKARKSLRKRINEATI